MDKYKILVKGIVKKSNDYLIVQRWLDDNFVSPYQWGFIDGEIEFGESPDKAVLRLIFEHTGISAVIDKILYTWSFMVGDVCNIGIAYLCMTAQEDVILSEQLNDVKWVSKDGLSTYITNEGILRDLERCERDALL